MILKRTITKTHSACNSNLLLWCCCSAMQQLPPRQINTADFANRSYVTSEDMTCGVSANAVAQHIHVFSNDCGCCLCSGWLYMPKVHCIWQCIATLHCKKLRRRNDHLTKQTKICTEKKKYFEGIHLYLRIQSSLFLWIVFYFDYWKKKSVNLVLIISYIYMTYCNLFFSKNIWGIRYVQIL